MELYAYEKTIISLLMVCLFVTGLTGCNKSDVDKTDTKKQVITIGTDMYPSYTSLQVHQA